MNIFKNIKKTTSILGISLICFSGVAPILQANAEEIVFDPNCTETIQVGYNQEKIKNEIQLVYLFDQTGSRQGVWKESKDSAKTIINTLKPDLDSAKLYSYSGALGIRFPSSYDPEATDSNPYGKDIMYKAESKMGNVEDAKNSINNVKMGDPINSATDTPYALNKVTDEFNKPKDSNKKSVLILDTDGFPNVDAKGDFLLDTDHPSGSFNDDTDVNVISKDLSDSIKKANSVFDTTIVNFTKDEKELKKDFGSEYEKYNKAYTNSFKNADYVKESNSLNELEKEVSKLLDNQRELPKKLIAYTPENMNVLSISNDKDFEINQNGDVVSKGTLKDGDFSTDITYSSGGIAITEETPIKIELTDENGTTKNQNQTLSSDFCPPIDPSVEKKVSDEDEKLVDDATLGNKGEKFNYTIDYTIDNSTTHKRIEFKDQFDFRIKMNEITSITLVDPKTGESIRDINVDEFSEDNSDYEKGTLMDLISENEELNKELIGKKIKIEVMAEYTVDTTETVPNTAEMFLDGEETDSNIVTIHPTEEEKITEKETIIKTETEIIKEIPKTGK